MEYMDRWMYRHHLRNRLVFKLVNNYEMYTIDLPIMHDRLIIVFNIFDGDLRKWIFVEVTVVPLKNNTMGSYNL